MFGFTQFLHHFAQVHVTDAAMFPALFQRYSWTQLLPYPINQTLPLPLDQTLALPLNLTLTLPQT